MGNDKPSRRLSPAELAERLRTTDPQVWEDLELQKAQSSSDLKPLADEVHRDFPYKDVYQATNKDLLRMIKQIMNQVEAPPLAAADKSIVRRYLLGLLDNAQHYGLSKPRNMRLVELLMEHYDISPEAPAEAVRGNSKGNRIGRAMSEAMSAPRQVASNVMKASAAAGEPSRPSPGVVREVGEATKM